MENQIVCPRCKKTISNKTIIDEAAKNQGSNKQTLVCDCGERLTYWQVRSQLRDQKKIGTRFQNWVRSFSRSKGV